MRRKKILIFIDHDVMIRHFIANDTFIDLEKNYEVLYVFNEDKDRFDFSNNEVLNKKIRKNKIRFTNIPRKRAGFWYLLHVINLFRRQRIAVGRNGSRSHYNAIVQQEKNLVGSRNVFLAKMILIRHLMKYFVSFKVITRERLFLT